MSPPPPRLSTATLPSARAEDLPAYDRSAPPAIAHLGMGAFARAHLATYADDLLRLGWPATVAGISLRSRTAEQQLVPQDGLFSVLQREAGQEPLLRVVGSITSAATGVAAAIESVAAPSTRLITLTVTEKGYELDPADLGPGGQPRSAPAVLAHGLARRNRRRPPIVAPLDNLLGNGHVLRAAVLQVAEVLDPGLARWIDAAVPFASSVVDRMVPSTSADDLAEVAQRLGLADHAAVVAERHRSWVITAVDGLPPLSDVGIEIVPSVEAHERRKLWLLNGPHSALAYAGLAAGCTTIAEAAGHPEVAPFVERVVDDVLEVADLPPSLAARAFADEAQRRFRNPDLGHTCAQVGADGSRKLRQRLVPVVAARRAAGLPTDRLARVAAAWLHALRSGQVDDPARDELAARPPAEQVARGLGLDDQPFVSEVAAAATALEQLGPGTLIGS
jgi:fructuronate reductase